MAELHHPAELRYTKTDEWVRREGDIAYLGITDYAQDQLGDIVNLEVAWDEAGTGTVRRERAFGNIDSVKASSELVSPISGTIIAFNDVLQTAPETINSDPYGAGWILSVRLTDPSEVDALLSGEEYLAYLRERDH